MSLVLFALGATIASSAQQKCCTCVRDGAQGFQIPQSTGCEIGCKDGGGTYVSLQACVGPGNPNPPPGSVPVPNTHCDPYWNEIGGSCGGNHWIECELAIYQRTPIAIAGEPVLVQFASQNLGQETGGGALALRHRLAVDGSVDWGDNSDKTHLDTGDYTLLHTYAKPGPYTVSAEIHGDFKWNELGAGNNSCSYRARTEPSSRRIDVLPPMLAGIDTSAWRLDGIDSEDGFLGALFVPIGNKIADFDVSCDNHNRFRINAGPHLFTCLMEFEQGSKEWTFRRVHCDNHQENAPSAVDVDCNELPNACRHIRGSASCMRVAP
jgi:hypothetical protein